MKRKHASAWIGVLVLLFIAAILSGCGAISSGTATRTGGNDAQSAILAPGFVVATNENLSAAVGNLSVFSVDSSTGALTPVGASPLVTAVDNPWGLVVHPNGQWVFIGSTVNRTVQGIKPSASGATSLGVATGSEPVARFNSQMAIDPQGSHLFTVHSNPVIDMFPISSAGALSARSTFTIPGAIALVGVATTNSFTYAADGGINRAIFVATNSNGTLTTKSALTVTVPTGNSIQTLAVSPNQKFLVVGTNKSDLWIYNIDGTTGALTPAFASPTPSAVMDASSDTEQIVFTPDSTAMYVADGDGQKVHHFAITSSGALTELPATATVGGQNFTDTIAIDPTGKFVYVGISSSFGPVANPEIMGFVAGSGSMAQIGGSNPSPYPIAGGNPISVGVTRK